MTSPPHEQGRGASLHFWTTCEGARPAWEALLQTIMLPRRKLLDPHGPVGYILIYTYRRGGAISAQRTSFFCSVPTHLVSAASLPSPRDLPNHIKIKDKMGSKSLPIFIVQTKLN